MPRKVRDEKYLPMKDPAPFTMTRGERIKELRLYFVNCLCEDPQDGSPFDSAVLDALDQIERNHPEAETSRPPDGIRRTVIIESTHQKQPPTFNAIFGVSCPECGNGPMAYEEGCMKCHLCGYSEFG